MIDPGLPDFRSRKPEGLLFLDETGTPDYLRPKRLADYEAAVAAGLKAPFPILFGLAGVLFRRQDYVAFDREFRQLKRQHLGADVPMHEYDLRTRKRPPFDMLDRPRWLALYSDLADLFNAHRFGIVVVAIHKPEMQYEYQAPLKPYHAYHYAMENIVERAAMECKNYAATWRLVAEDREEGLNKQLGREMVRLQADGCGKGINKPRSNVTAAEVQHKFDPAIWFRKKTDNDSGLQVADLAVGPLVRYIFGADAGERRSVRDIVLPKLVCARDGCVRGFGAKCYPRFPKACRLQ